MGDAGSDHGDGSIDEPPDDGSDRPLGAPPDPLDRLWLHPSELAPFVGRTESTRPRPAWASTVVAGAAGALLTIAVLGATGALGTSSKSSDTNLVPTSTPVATARAIAVSVGPAVVAVSVREPNGTRRGSGVCIRQSGEVLTSSRLVGNATIIDVTTSDGKDHRARVIGRDPTTDLVLLSVPSRLPTAEFATQPPSVLDNVWIVGAPDPGDDQPWMTSGQLASTDSLLSLSSGPRTSGLLETAAASSAGSSGGALADRTGQVAGIVLAPIAGTRTTYAVPIATALAIADGLRTRGYVEHGALGIEGTDAPGGATVTRLVAAGPARRAGVRVGDVLRSIDGHRIDTMDDVMALVRHDAPGLRVTIVLSRGSRTLTVEAVLTGIVVR